jgi:hypothetical protein
MQQVSFLVYVFIDILSLEVLLLRIRLVTDQKETDLSGVVLSIANSQMPQTNAELIALAKNATLCSENQILQTILKLQNEGKLTFIESSAPGTQRSIKNVNSNQTLWYQAIVAIAVITTITAFVINEDFYPWSYIRNILGLIFILWLPGYSFMRALFPSRFEPKDSSILNNAEKVALSVIMSLAIVALMGFALNFTTFGIRFIPIILSMLTFTLSFATVAVLREHYKKPQ